MEKESSVNLGYRQNSRGHDFGYNQVPIELSIIQRLPVDLRFIFDLDQLRALRKNFGLFEGFAVVS